MIDLEVLKVQTLPDELYDLYSKLQCQECGHIMDKFYQAESREWIYDCDFCGSTESERV